MVYARCFELYVRLFLVKLVSKVSPLNLLKEDYIPSVVIDYIYVALRLGIKMYHILKYIDALLRLCLKMPLTIILFLSASTRELVRRRHRRRRAEHSRMYLRIQQMSHNLLSTFIKHGETMWLIVNTEKSLLETLRIILCNLK